MKILCVFGRNAYGDPKRGAAYEFTNFYPALAHLSSDIRLFDSFDRAAYRDFADLNESLLRTVAEFEPDVIFAVLMHYEIWTETLDAIRRHSPAAILHWGTDDSWKFAQFSRYIAHHVDVHATTDANAFARARSNGLDNVMPTQWAASAALLAPPLPSAECAFDVTFVGSAYGNRRQWIAALRERGISVRCFGHGWEGGAISADEVGKIIRSSRISLNFGDSGLQLNAAGVSRSRQIKARTFEVPGAGGFLLTEMAPGLETYLVPGRDVDTFADAAELESKIRRYLADPQARDTVATAGHARVAREHTYESRFPPLIAAALARAQQRQIRGFAVEPTLIARDVRRHRLGVVAQGLQAVVVNGSTRLFGPRAPRALRRALFETSWRMRGARVYSARGLAGRLFYAQS